jgi:glyoxylate reductase
MQVLFYDPVPPPPEFLNKYHMSYRVLHDLLAESDIVTLHTPLVEATHHIINKQALQTMKSSALLINGARGDLVDETALLEALQTGQIAGAACDVFAVEPAFDNPLLKLDNFIATAHNGSGTVQTTLRMGLLASQNALAVLRGEKPEHVVNPEVFE